MREEVSGGAAACASLVGVGVCSAILDWLAMVTSAPAPRSQFPPGPPERTYSEVGKQRQKTCRQRQFGGAHRARLVSRIFARQRQAAHGGERQKEEPDH